MNRNVSTRVLTVPARPARPAPLRSAGPRFQPKKKSPLGRIFRWLIRNRYDVTESGYKRKVNGTAQLQRVLEGTEGLIVLFREGLVKVDTSCSAFAPLKGHRDVDASPGTALLDSLLKGFFQVI